MPSGHADIFKSDTKRSKLGSPAYTDHHMLAEPLGEAPQRPKVLKYVSLICCIFGSLGDLVLLKKASNIARYPAALSFLSAATGILICPVFIIGAYAFQVIDLHQLKIPWWKPVGIGALFALHSVLHKVGASSPAVPGSAISALGMLVVPFSMLVSMSSVSLGLKYRRWHWASIALLLAGVAVTLWFSYPGGAGTGVTAAAGDSMDAEARKCLCLMVVSAAPLAIAFVCIEAILVAKHVRLFTVAFWFYICIVQAVLYICLSGPTEWLVRQTIGVGHSDDSGSGSPSSFAVMWEGFRCYVFGIGPSTQVYRYVDGEKEQDCYEAGLTWYYSLIFTLTMNLAMPLSVKYGGNTLMWCVRSLCVPVGGFLFSAPFVMGEQAISLSIGEMIGFAGVVIGAWAFIYQRPIGDYNRV